MQQLPGWFEVYKTPQEEQAARAITRKAMREKRRETLYSQEWLETFDTAELESALSKAFFEFHPKHKRQTKECELQKEIFIAQFSEFLEFGLAHQKGQANPITDTALTEGFQKNAKQIQSNLETSEIIYDVLTTFRLDRSSIVAIMQGQQVLQHRER